MMGEAITKQHITVPIIETTYCRWCLGKIRVRVIAERIKTSSHDRATHVGKTDYHEECWAEAIEVQC